MQTEEDMRRIIRHKETGIPVYVQDTNKRFRKIRKFFMTVYKRITKQF